MVGSIVVFLNNRLGGWYMSAGAGGGHESLGALVTVSHEQPTWAMWTSARTSVPDHWTMSPAPQVWGLGFWCLFCMVRSCLSRALLFRNVKYLELAGNQQLPSGSSVLMISIWSHLSFSLHSPEVSTELHIWSRQAGTGQSLLSALLPTRMMPMPAPSRVHSRHSGHTGPQLELSMKTTWRKILPEQ